MISPALPVLCLYLSLTQVMMWLDILTLPQARRYPPVPMEPPSPLKVSTVDARSVVAEVMSYKIRL